MVWLGETNATVRYLYDKPGSQYDADVDADVDADDDANDDDDDDSSVSVIL